MIKKEAHTANMRFGNSGGRQNSYFNFGNFIELRFQLDRTQPNSRNLNSTFLSLFNGRRPSVTQLNAPPSPSLVRCMQGEVTTFNVKFHGDEGKFFVNLPCENR